MGFDIECNLVLEAISAAHRERIKQLRNHLLAEHLGVTDQEVAKALRTHGLARLPELARGPRRLTAQKIEQLHPVFGPVLAPLFDRDEQWIRPTWDLLGGSARRMVPMQGRA
jgi:hypothetical protein